MESSSRWLAPGWAEAVPQLLSRCIDRWQLRIEGPLSGGYLARVYSCSDVDGNQLILKLSPPEARPVLEAAALGLWAGRGAVSLRDWDARAGALLLDRIVPATPLPPGCEEESIRTAADILSELHRAAVPSDHPFPVQAEAFDWYVERVRADAEPDAIGVPVLDKAGAVAHKLWSTVQEQSVLLHGDFIDKNLLLGSAGFVAIDPMPFVGDPCSDIGFFAANHPPASDIVARARALALRLGRDVSRAERWAAVYAVGQACETWRSDTDMLVEWVSSRDCAALLEV